MNKRIISKKIRKIEIRESNQALQARHQAGEEIDRDITQICQFI